jgi:hypothetical protein
MTVLGALLVQPWLGPLVGGFVLLALFRPPWRRALRLAPAIIIGATAAYVTLAQIVHRYPSEFQWAKRFTNASIPVWIALMLLAADALIASVWRTDVDESAPEAEDTTVPA